MHRIRTFLTEWDKEGPKTIGLPKANHQATTLELAKKLMDPLVANATKGGRLHTIVRDLQVTDPTELLAKSNGLYLQALFEARDDDTIQ